MNKFSKVQILIQRKFFYFYHRLKLYLSNLFSYLREFDNFYLFFNVFLRKLSSKNIVIEYTAKNTKFNFPDLKFIEFKMRADDKVDCSTIYPCSDDVFKIRGNFDTPQLFLGIANLTSLDVISNLEPNILFFADLNKAQLKYLEFIINLIEKSETRTEFLSKLFGKKNIEVSKILEKADEFKEDLSFIEDEFWKCRDEKKHINEMHKEFLDYQIIKENGVYKGIIHKKIGTNVFGKLRAVTTFILNDKNQIKIPKPFGVFPIYKDKGFLSSENKYKHLRNILLDKPYIMINTSLSADLISAISNGFKYYKIVLWLSNILNQCFLSKDTYKLIDRILFLKFFSSEYHKINILEDQRRQFFNIIHERKTTPHWDAFSKVLKYLKGECLEIVNLENRVKEGTRLPDTKPIYYTNFLSYKENCDSIFIHILVGNGMDIETYKKVVKEAFKKSKRVILLEHNRKSKDFRKKNIGLTTGELIEMFGEPTALEYSSGFKSKKRNIIVLYNNTEFIRS